MVLLPNVEAVVVDGQALEVERSPVAIRALQLLNTDAKLLACIANRGLTDIAEEVCGDHQRGFVRSRVLWDDVVELD